MKLRFFYIVIFLFSLCDASAQLISEPEVLEKCNTSITGVKTSYIEYRTVYNKNNIETFRILCEDADGATIPCPTSGVNTLGFCPPSAEKWEPHQMCDDRGFSGQTSFVRFFLYEIGNAQPTYVDFDAAGNPYFPTGLVSFGPCVSTMLNQLFSYEMCDNGTNFIRVMWTNYQYTTSASGTQVVKNINETGGNHVASGNEVYGFCNPQLDTLKMCLDSLKVLTSATNDSLGNTNYLLDSLIFELDSIFSQLDTTDYFTTENFVCVDDTTTMKERIYWENNTDLITVILDGGIAANPIPLTYQYGQCSSPGDTLDYNIVHDFVCVADTITLMRKSFYLNDKLAFEEFWDSTVLVTPVPAKYQLGVCNQTVGGDWELISMCDEVIPDSFITFYRIYDRETDDTDASFKDILVGGESYTPTANISNGVCDTSLICELVQIEYCKNNVTVTGFYKLCFDPTCNVTTQRLIYFLDENGNIKPNCPGAKMGACSTDETKLPITYYICVNDTTALVKEYYTNNVLDSVFYYMGDSLIASPTLFEMGQCSPPQIKIECWESVDTTNKYCVYNGECNVIAQTFSNGKGLTLLKRYISEVYIDGRLMDLPNYPYPYSCDSLDFQIDLEFWLTSKGYDFVSASQASIEIEGDHVIEWLQYNEYYDLNTVNDLDPPLVQTTFSDFVYRKNQSCEQTVTRYEVCIADMKDTVKITDYSNNIITSLPIGAYQVNCDFEIEESCNNWTGVTQCYTKESEAVGFYEYVNNTAFQTLFDITQDSLVVNTSTTLAVYRDFFQAINDCVATGNIVKMCWSDAYYEDEKYCYFIESVGDDPTDGNGYYKGYTNLGNATGVQPWEATARCGLDENRTVAQWKSCDGKELLWYDGLSLIGPKIRKEFSSCYGGIGGKDVCENNTVSVDELLCDENGDKYIVTYSAESTDTVYLTRSSFGGGVEDVRCFPSSIIFNPSSINAGVDINEFNAGGVSLYPSDYSTYTDLQKVDWWAQQYGFKNYDYEDGRMIATRNADICVSLEDNPPGFLYFTFSNGAISQNQDGFQGSIFIKSNAPSELFQCEESVTMCKERYICSNDSTFLMKEFITNMVIDSTVFLYDNSPLTYTPSNFEYGVCVAAVIDTPCPNTNPIWDEKILSANGTTLLDGDAYDMTIMNYSDATIRVQIGINQVSVGPNSVFSFPNQPCTEPPLGNSVTISTAITGSINLPDNAIIINYKWY